MAAITNGKVYRSKASAYQVLVRPRTATRYNSQGDAIEFSKPLTAEFAFHGGEFSFQNPLTGNNDVAADIRGHFFDSVQQAVDKGWTQEEHDEVVDSLDRLCVTAPEYIWEIVAARAEKPWPTYDETHHNQVVSTAVLIGKVYEALVYEEENKARLSVLDGLREKLTERTPAEDGEIAVA